MRDGRKLLARELVEEVVLLHLETPADFDAHYVNRCQNNQMPVRLLDRKHTLILLIVG
jgi:hypothetical protein